MPKGPQGQKRPGDVIGAAVMVARIATGEISASDATEADDGKDPAAKALGAKGGKARAAKMDPERRAEIARKAAVKRWGAGRKQRF
jgi:general stress protein YciG